MDIPNKENVTVRFNFFDPHASLQKLLDLHFHRPYFVRNASKVFNSNFERVYSTPETCDWWLQMQATFVFINNC